MKQAMTAVNPVMAVVLLLTLGSAAGHKLGIGPCPDVPSMKSFDVNQFFGKWFINEVYANINTCMTLTFAAIPNSTTEIKATQGRQLPALDAVNVKHTTTYVGTIITGPQEAPAKMTIKWPLSGAILGRMAYTVIDTDYKNYALTYECRSFLFGRYYSATILTRETLLDPTVMEEVKKKAAEAGLDTSLFKVVSQKTCTAPGEGIDFSQHEDAYNLLGLISDDKLQAIKTDAQLIEILGHKPPAQP
ncbi:apolipoprotein D [Hyalella azteca]|uniref:Apolipoprotein D n=1 Tax=Hyalella azteca TaxID=294128 RepID=A0A8B7NVW6_HYAAZ|nr:apolipoprotein D [Hyalella azteca]XP_018017083.1 apolipoprotein D [Hyalella azteca]